MSTSTRWDREGQVRWPYHSLHIVPEISILQAPRRSLTGIGRQRWVIHSKFWPFRLILQIVKHLQIHWTRYEAIIEFVAVTTFIRKKLGKSRCNSKSVQPQSRKMSHLPVPCNESHSFRYIIESSVNDAYSSWRWQQSRETGRDNSNDIQDISRRIHSIWAPDRPAPVLYPEQIW